MHWEQYQTSHIERGTNRIAGGWQWMSWAGRDQLANIIQYILVADTLVGPVKPVSPNAVGNADCVAIAARVLRRKPGPPMPAFLLRLMLGVMAEQFALASRRIEPYRLLASGYSFRFPDLEGALRHELGRR